MSTETQLGTAELQGRLWTVNAANWAELHEQYTQPAYVAALDAQYRVSLLFGHRQR